MLTFYSGMRLRTFQINNEIGVYILTDFKNAALGWQLNFRFHKRTPSDHFHSALKAD